MKVNFNFVKTSHLLKQYADQLQSIFVQYSKKNYNEAVKIIGSVFNHVISEIYAIEDIQEKSIDGIKQKHIYPDAILNNISIIIHGDNLASKDESITEQDFFTQLTSLHDLLAYLVNIYENGQVKYWDAQLAYKSSADKDNLFKPREMKNDPVSSDTEVNADLDLDFDSKKKFEEPKKAEEPEKTKETKKSEDKKPEEKKDEQPTKTEKPAISTAKLGKVEPIRPIKKEKAPEDKKVEIKKDETKDETKKEEPAPKVEKTEPVKPVKAEKTAEPVTNKAKTPTNSAKPKRKARKKSKKSRGRKIIAFVGIAAIIAGGSFGINRLLEENSQSTTVVSDAKVSRKSSSKKKSEKAKKLALQKKREEEAKLKKEQARKDNWIAGSIYQLNIKTKGISGTVNKAKKATLNLPSPSLSKKVYVVFNPDYTQKNFVSVTDLKTARQAAKSQTKFDKLVKKNADYKFDNDRLTIVVPGLTWSYPMSPYNAIQLSKQGRKKVNNMFATALTNAKLNKKSNKNTFMINKQLSGKDFSNTSWDNYRATYRIETDFNKVK